MSIYNFVSQEELEALPHHDPTQAFAEFTRIAQGRFEEALAHQDGSDITEVRYDFQKLIVTAAKRWNVMEVANLKMSPPGSYGYQDFRAFQVELNGVIADLAIMGATRPKWGTVFIPQGSKETIRSKLAGLRKAVQEATLDPKTRQRLLSQLDTFEKALEQQRFELVHLALLALTMATIPGGVMDSMTAFSIIAQEVQKAVGYEQEREALLQQIETNPVPSISGPRPSVFPAFEVGADEDLPF